MPLVINTNLASLGAQHRLERAEAGVATSLRRLSSGLRINGAQDDAAGLAVSERMNAQLRGTRQALRNVNDGISMFQTGEQALGSMNERLQRMRELAVQSLNGTVSLADRRSLDEEVQASLEEVQRTASSTSFNRHRMLDGSAGRSTFQIGADAGDGLDIDLSTDLRTDHLGAIATARTADLRTINSVGGGGGFGFSGTYTTVSLDDLDFSRPAVSLVPGRATAMPGTTSYGGGQATVFAVDGINVNLNANYGSLGVVAGVVQAQLDAAVNGAYAVTQDGTRLTVSRTSRGGSPAVAVSMSAVSGPNAAPFGNATSVTGVQGSRTTNAGFSVDGHRVSITRNHSGNMAGLLADIRNQLGGAYEVVGDELGISFLHTAPSKALDTPVVNGFTDNGYESFARGSALALTLKAGDLSVQLGTRKAVSITGSFSTPEALARAVQAKVPGVVTRIDKTTGQLEINATQTLTVRGAQAGSSGKLAFDAEVHEPEGSLAEANVRDTRASNLAVLRIDAAIDTLSTQRARFGATLSRFESIVGSLQGNEEVIGASRGRIVDADYAAESASLASHRVLRDASMAVLAMVNVGPRDVLALLRPG